MVKIKAGTKLYSAVCDTQIMVLRVPADDLDVHAEVYPCKPKNY